MSRFRLIPCKGYNKRNIKIKQLKESFFLFDSETKYIEHCNVLIYYRVYSFSTAYEYYIHCTQMASNKQLFTEVEVNIHHFHRR